MDTLQGCYICTTKPEFGLIDDKMQICQECFPIIKPKPQEPKQPPCECPSCQGESGEKRGNVLQTLMYLIGSKRFDMNDLKGWKL